MKFCLLQGLFVALICSYASSILIRVLPVSNNQCHYEEAKTFAGKFVYDYISEQLSRNDTSKYGTWTQVAYMNMSDLTQFCPSTWTINTTVRACGRQESSSASCHSVFFSTNGMEYSQVSGRITGYQYGTPHAFHFSIYFNPGIDNAYIDGVSLTHGAPGSRTHVWSFVNAWTETGGSGATHICACMLSNYSEWQHTVPDFVGNNYFCATGHNRYFYSHHVILFHNPLWDGEGCTGSNTCCQFNQPPWFYRTLPAPTTDDLEVRICGSRPTKHENIFISHIELYVK